MAGSPFSSLLRISLYSRHGHTTGSLGRSHYTELELPGTTASALVVSPQAFSISPESLPASGSWVVDCPTGVLQLSEDVVLLLNILLDDKPGYHHWSGQVQGGRFPHIGNIRLSLHA